MFETIKNMFKKNKIEKIPLSLITVKRKKDNFNLYKGKFVSIEAELPEKYYFTIFDRETKTYIKITDNVDKKYFELCSNYNYGLIYDYNDIDITIAIICQKGYLKTYDIELYKNFENGESFVVNNNDLLNNNRKVGIIKNNYNEIISMNCLENNKLIGFIKK